MTTSIELTAEQVDLLKDHLTTQLEGLEGDLFCGDMTSQDKIYLTKEVSALTAILEQLS